MDKPDVSLLLKPLKSFQRRTVKYVFRRLYRENVNRYLVADEVGLGKTLVARGVIALAINELWPRLDDLGRIDVIYICSNGDIARQNINRLNVFNSLHGNGNHLAFATRLTMLPLYLKKLENGDYPVNFISFTPGTSFNLRSRGGIGDERAMLYNMLAERWEFCRDNRRREAARHIFRLHVDKSNWQSYLDRAARAIRNNDGIDLELLGGFLAELKGETGLLDQFEELVSSFSAGQDISRKRIDFLGKIRRCLARICVRHMDPDLIILDEFQRFRDLLDGDDDAAILAQDLFNMNAGSETRLILLSATPYRLYNTREEAEDFSHYSDLLRTIRFLYDEDSEFSKSSVPPLVEEGPRTKKFRVALKEYGEELFQAAAEHRKVRSEVVRAVEECLRPVMVRTERLGTSEDSRDMITSGIEDSDNLVPGDLEQFALVDDIASQLGVGDPLEYWKSAPYLLNLMDRRGYRLKECFADMIQEETEKKLLAKPICARSDALIDWHEIEHYGALAIANARLRSLAALALPEGADSLLWIPPTFPYYEASVGPYSRPGLRALSKVLVFSSWLIVPKAISMLLSYEAERRMISNSTQTARQFRYSDYSERTRLLEFRISESSKEQMTHMTLLYPCFTLATAIDPVSICGACQRSEQINEMKALEWARDRTRDLVNSVVPSQLHREGPADRRWYWVVLALLDRDQQCVNEWLSTRDELFAWDKMVLARQDESNFATYVTNLREIIEGQDVSELGRPPEDLPEVVARIALGSPAVAALRSLLRVTRNPKTPKERMQLLAEAARIAMGFRSLFNAPMVSAMVRREQPTSERGYWRSVLAYCLGGNLQAVLDEYCHVLRESLGLLDREPTDVAAEIAAEISTAVSLRTVNLEFDEIVVDEAKESVCLHGKKRSIRCRYAMRFGDGRSERESGIEAHITRKEHVRQAFNSPFWPFVLATTSIGQEGLDFHQYCRHIMHWNLPRNPVDLEQREGRIHRYKGHAVRWNVVDHARSNGIPGGCDFLEDTWEEIFQYAEDTIGDNDKLVPYWLVPCGDYKIERHVPLYPLSREQARFEDLTKKLALYRLAFGQPRQEDLLTYLQSRSAETPGGGFQPVYIKLSPDNT